MSVSSESTATFTCTVGGYPLKSVTISGPNNVNLDCLTTQTSGDVSCSSSDKSNYVVKVQNFKLEYSGDYICTVNTKWYKADNIAAIEDSAQDNVALSFGNVKYLRFEYLVIRFQKLSSSFYYLRANHNLSVFSYMS